MENIEKKIREGYRRLTETLIEKGLTITTMESATSGQIASLITDTEGSSAVLKGAFVTYCNEAKIMQGVPKEIIDNYGVYSEETAAAMACAASDAYHADIAIGVTGTFGNTDISNADSVPGQVYFAITYMDKIYSFSAKLTECGSRLEYKFVMAGLVLDHLEKLLGIEQGSKEKIHVNEKCNGCGLCVVFCPKQCINISCIPVAVDQQICDGCGLCIPHCMLRAIEKSN